VRIVKIPVGAKTGILAVDPLAAQRERRKGAAEHWGGTLGQELICIREIGWEG
jgi:hypothetical protein